MAATKTTKKSARFIDAILSFVAKHNHWLLVIGLLVIFVMYAFIHHQRHITFYTMGWDLAVFDQPVYLLSQGKLPFSSLHNTHTFGDHYHPLMLGLGAVLYNIWADPRMLLWLETAIAVSSGGMLFLLCRRISLSALNSLFLSFMYLFSVGFQAMLLDDFHDDVLVTLPLISLFYFLKQKNWWGYWVSVVGVLLIKEEFGLLVAAIGILIILKHKLFCIGIMTMIAGITTFFLLLEIVMPRFATGTYWQYAYRHYSDTNRPSVVIKTFVRDPYKLITTLVNHPQKQKTLLTGALSFGFLPLAAPIFIVPIGETLLIRFIDATAPLRFTFNNHYNGPYIALLAIASAYGARKIKFKLLPIYIIAATALQHLLFHGPLSSLFKSQFYQLPSWQPLAQQLVSKVPSSGSLTTQNFLLPHLSQRESFYLLPDIENADYIAALLINHPTDFYGPSLPKLQSLLYEATISGKYRLYWQQNQAIILQRNP